VCCALHLSDFAGHDFWSRGAGAGSTDIQSLKYNRIIPLCVSLAGVIFFYLVLG
jgi:hypothetical protein